MGNIHCHRQTDRQTGEVVEYNTLRALVMILVVVGHCTYYTISGSSMYGGIDYGGAMKVAGILDTQTHIWASRISSFIYTFHMPLFMAISGAVLELGWRNGKYRDRNVFIRKKIHRLLIPFLCVTLFYVIPVKYLAGYWNDSVDPVMDILIGQILIQGNTHLWFLPTLFCEFIIFYLLIIERYSPNEKKRILILILFGSCLISRNIPIKLIAYILEYGIYFYAGMLFECYRSSINTHINTRWVSMGVLTWLVLFVIHYEFVHTSTFALNSIKRIDEIIMAFVGIMTFYGVMIIALRKKLLSGKLVSLFVKYSFGIYLYSDSLNYVILAGFVYIFSILGFGSEFLSAGLYFVRLIFTFLGGLIITVAVARLENIFRKC